MTFNAIVTADRLVDFLEPVSALVDECKLHLGVDGLRIAAVDPANVAMVEATLDAGGFESYESDGGVIGLNLNAFEDVLALADSGDLVHLELDEQVRKLDIRFGSVDYTQALINPETVRQEPDLPSIDWLATAVATGKQLDQAVTAADLVDDHIQLVSDGPERALATDAAGDTDDVQVEYDRDDLVDASLGDGRVSSMFSLDYVSDIVGTMDADAEVTVQLANEMPAKLSWAHSEGQASATVLISPRIAGGG
jgi:proliferating cell nuclear antigen